MSPLAPAEETALASNPDSTLMIAMTSRGSTPCCPAYRSASRATPSAAELEKAAAEARKMLQPQVEQLQTERGQLEKQLYRARATGDGYAQIRFRTLLEQNREALEKLIPKQ